MDDPGDVAVGWPEWQTSPRRRMRRWLLPAVLAFAFLLILGVGTLVGSAIAGARAAGLGAGAGSNGPALAFGPGPQTLASGPGATGAHGECAAYAVSSVSGNTIVAKASDGSTVTIHTTASTQYTRAGQSASASAVTVGGQIRVRGTHNSDGSITATEIDVG